MSEKVRMRGQFQKKQFPFLFFFFEYPMAVTISHPITNCQASCINSLSYNSLIPKVCYQDPIPTRDGHPLQHGFRRGSLHPDGVFRQRPPGAGVLRQALPHGGPHAPGGHGGHAKEQSRLCGQRTANPGEQRHHLVVCLLRWQYTMLHDALIHYPSWRAYILCFMTRVYTMLHDARIHYASWCAYTLCFMTRVYTMLHDARIHYVSWRAYTLCFMTRVYTMLHDARIHYASWRAYTLCFMTRVYTMLHDARIHYASWRSWYGAANIVPHASWSTTTYTMLQTPNYYRSITVPTTSCSKWLISNLF